jgi:hypothetical protein
MCLRVLLLSKVLLLTSIINLRNWDKPKIHVDSVYTVETILRIVTSWPAVDQATPTLYQRSSSSSHISLTGGRTLQKYFQLLSSSVNCRNCTKFCFIIYIT